MYVCADPLCQAIELDWNILVVLVPQRASVCVLFYLINRKYKFRAKKRTFRACCICKCSAFCTQWVINKIVVGFSDRCCCKIYRCWQRKKRESKIMCGKLHLSAWQTVNYIDMGNFPEPYTHQTSPIISLALALSHRPCTLFTHFISLFPLYN